MECGLYSTGVPGADSRPFRPQVTTLRKFPIHIYSWGTENPILLNAIDWRQLLAASTSSVSRKNRTHANPSRDCTALTRRLYALRTSTETSALLEDPRDRDALIGRLPRAPRDVATSEVGSWSIVILNSNVKDVWRAGTIT